MFLFVVSGGVGAAVVVVVVVVVAAVVVIVVASAVAIDCICLPTEAWHVVPRSCLGRFFDATIANATQ